MKKFTYLLAVAAVFTACNSGNNGYTVTGTVEGAADGDTVYLETVEGRQFVKLDSAVIKDGTFNKILLSTATSPTKPKEKTAQPSTSSWKTARLKSTCRRKTTLPPVLPTMMPTRKSEPKSTV